MNLLFFSVAFATALASITFIASIILTQRSLSDREKLAPFECGFDPNNLARIPFSLRFFLLALIFLVFDIEIVLLIPIPIIYSMPTGPYQILTGILFILILLIGLLHEWLQGSLNWSPS